MQIPSSLTEYRKLVGARIKQAREDAGFKNLADLSGKIPGWSPSRLHNYEKGVSSPNPLDIASIAEITNTNPCWMIYGIGSMAARNSDIHAIRHQNFKYVAEVLISSPAEATDFRNMLKLKPSEYKKLLNDPTAKITATVCRKVERELGKPKGWMDEQHVETDGAYEYFPDDIKELLTIYSGLDPKNRSGLLEIAKILGR